MDGRFFFERIFVHLPKEYEGGLDVHTWRWVLHENVDLHNDGGMVVLLRASAPLVCLRIGLVRQMK